MGRGREKNDRFGPDIFGGNSRSRTVPTGFDQDLSTAYKASALGLESSGLTINDKRQRKTVDDR